MPFIRHLKRTISQNYWKTNWNTAQQNTREFSYPPAAPTQTSQLPRSQLHKISFLTSTFGMRQLYFRNFSHTFYGFFPPFSLYTCIWRWRTKFWSAQFLLGIPCPQLAFALPYFQTVKKLEVKNCSSTVSHHYLNNIIIRTDNRAEDKRSTTKRQTGLRITIF